MKYVSIEGNVGAGKTTFVRKAADYHREKKKARPGQPQQLSPNLHVPLEGVDAVLEEPVNDWISVLGDFYENPSRFSLSLQLKILFSRAKQLRDTIGNVAVTERCIDSSSGVFVPVLCEDGMMSAQEFDIYQECLSMTRQMYLHELVGVVFINTSPSTCYERIIKRNREGESGVTLDYLMRLHEQYLSWISKLKSVGVPVIEVDGERPTDTFFHDTLKEVTAIVNGNNAV